jgi:hypothetical protein
MGRKKYMLDGALRGRNELIQDSIRRDTGITRCRKQVSSHLQVLKHHLSNVPSGKYRFPIHMTETQRFGSVCHDALQESRLNTRLLHRANLTLCSFGLHGWTG